MEKPIWVVSLAKFNSYSKKEIDEMIENNRNKEEVFNKDTAEERIVTYLRLKSYREYCRFAKPLGIKPMAKEKSVEYYIKYFVLLYSEDGPLVLKNEAVCSDKEWEKIKENNNFNKEEVRIN